jgi:hypothetical protein
MKGFYDITTKLKDHFTADPIINTVTEGDIFEVDLNKQTIFPLVHMMINNASFETNVVRFNVSLIAMDIVDISKKATTDIFRGNSNEQDVLNTQLEVLNRAYALMFTVICGMISTLLMAIQLVSLLLNVLRTLWQDGQ